MTTPRYLVRELSGYNITPSSTDNETRHKARPTTDVYVLDSWYGYAVVYKQNARRGIRLRDRQRLCRRMAWRWNREHEAWLAA
jgi:hypothetical protein